MARKITSGRVGRAILGSLSIDDAALKSVRTNANISLEPNGSGITSATSDLEIRGARSLRLGDSDSSNYIALRAPDTVAGNLTYTFPGTITTDFFLKTDVNGVLSWSAAAVNVTNQTTDVAVYYPVMTTATSGTLTAVNTSSTKLTFQPSTGTITSTLSRVTGGTVSSSTTTGTLVVTGGVGVSGQATINNISVTATTASTTTSSGALTVAGGVGIIGQLTATTVVETSSIAFKENVEPIDNALATVMQLLGVTYDRTDNNEHEAGLIAEDVYKVVPDLVSKDADGNPHGIKYSKLTAYLIEAVKSLKQEIDVLKGTNSG